MGFTQNRTILAAAVAALALGGCASSLTAPERAREAEVHSAPAPLERSRQPGGVEAVVLAEDQGSTVKRPPKLERPGSTPAIPLVQDRQPAALAPDGEDIVQFDFDQVELREVLEEIADAIGISLVIDASIADKVTMRTSPDRPLRHADLWPLLRLLMNEAGVALEKRGAVYHARKVAGGLPADMGNTRVALESAGGLAMQITPLRNVNIDSALTVLRPLVEPAGRIVSLPGMNMLGIVSSPEQLKRINHMIALVDADPFIHRGMRLFPLGNAKAADVAKDLQAIIGAVEGTASAYQVVALDRINAVLVVSPPQRGFGEVERWVDILDSGSGEGGERVFIYRVKNLEAKALASTLSSVFKSEGGTPKAEEEPKAGDIVKRTEKVGSDEQKTEEAQPTNLGEAMKQAMRGDTARGSSSPGTASASLQVSIVADEDTNSLLVRALPRDYKQLLETIAELDRVPQEVMINVVIAEVTLDDSNRFGVEWKALNSSGRSSIFSSYGMAAENANGTLSGLIINQVSNRLTTLLNILDSESDLRVLSRPSILVRDNQEAVIKIGSEEPVLTRVTTSGTTVDGTSQLNNDIQYRDTGIILTVTPHINEDGIINMEVHQEISQVNESSGTLGLPRFTNREVKTSAVVRDGAALILGGIIQDRLKVDNAGVPGLKSLPGVGGLFSDETQAVTRTELVLIMVPELVNPHADNTEVMQSLYGRLSGVAELLDLYGLKDISWN